MREELTNEDLRIIGEVRYGPIKDVHLYRLCTSIMRSRAITPKQRNFMGFLYRTVYLKK